MNNQMSSQRQMRFGELIRSLISECLLVEDLATDGKSKLKFVNAIRSNGLKVRETFVIFYYDIFKKAKSDLKKTNIKIHYLCTWHNILDEIKKQKKISNKNIKAIESFLFNKSNWN